MLSSRAFVVLVLTFMSVLLSWWLSGKESACEAGDSSLIPGLGRSPSVGNDNPFQYSCLESSVNRGSWRATVHGITESNMTEHAYTFMSGIHSEVVLCMVWLWIKAYIFSMWISNCLNTFLSPLICPDSFAKKLLDHKYEYESSAPSILHLVSFLLH